MCDIRLFRFAYTEYELAKEIYQIPRNDEAFLNGIATTRYIEKDLRDKEIFGGNI